MMFGFMDSEITPLSDEDLMEVSGGKNEDATHGPIRR